MIVGNNNIVCPASQFITEQFLKQSGGQQVLLHFCASYDQDVIRNVWHDVQQIIINMSIAGMTRAIISEIPGVARAFISITSENVKLLLNPSMLCSSREADPTSRRITKNLRQRKKQERFVKKILMLGPGMLNKIKLEVTTRIFHLVSEFGAKIM